MHMAEDIDFNKSKLLFTSVLVWCS